MIIVQRYHEWNSRVFEHIENRGRQLIVKAVDMRQIRLEVFHQPRQALFGVERVNAVPERFHLSGRAEVFHARIGETVNEVAGKWGRQVLRMPGGEMSDFMAVLCEQIAGLKKKCIRAARQPEGFMYLQDTHSIP